MKVVVFGGSGFLGSHLVDVLSEKGHEVVVFDLYPSKYLKGQKMIAEDILDRDKVAEAVDGSDVVYNFAGVADLEGATTMPLETVKYNILGNCNILEACRNAGVKRYIYASTVYVYSSLGGFYRCSKQAAELYIEEYRRKYGLNFTILRYGTVYGTRTDERNSIHRYLKQALTKRKIRWYGDGEELREYIHVNDAAELSVKILEKEYENQYVTITGHHPTKFKDMLNTINEMLGGDIEIELEPPKAGSSHYSMTPYSFIPKIGKKLVSNHYTDLGQGFLEILEEIQGQIKEDNK